jgi:shikimate dehydrogenase
LYTLKKYGIRVKGKKTLIFGAGGASKALSVALTKNGAGEIVFVDIAKGKNAISPHDALRKHADADILINASPAGMFPQVDSIAFDVSRFQKTSAVIDIVYNPLRTNVILDARAEGKLAASGLLMLVAQAKYALELFKNISIDDSKIDEIHGELLLATSNIALIGMPSSGKTTIAKALAKQLDKKFYDVDQEIELEAKKPIAKIFEEDGESAFRKLEIEVTSRIALETNAVISCGGGIVKNEENIFNLKRNSVIALVDRDISKLTSEDGSRPLSKTKDDFKKLYKERKPLYEAMHEIRINNNSSINAAVKSAEKAYEKALLTF